MVRVVKHRVKEEFHLPFRWYSRSSAYRRHCTGRYTAIRGRDLDEAKALESKRKS